MVGVHATIAQCPKLSVVLRVKYMYRVVGWRCRMLVILFEYSFHQPYFPAHVHGFYLKTFLLLLVEFLYVIKLCVATRKSILRVQVRVVIS